MKPASSLRPGRIALLVLAAAACSSTADDPAGGAERASTPAAAAAPAAPGPAEAVAAPPAAAAPAAPAPPAQTASQCFQALTGAVTGPDYDKLAPVVATSCAGTHHQTITGVQKVVFLGDSITAGTPPTPAGKYYRSVLAGELQKRFGPLEIKDCSKWGARMDDLLEGQDEIGKCFPSSVEPKRTLVVMTMGGNDIHAWAKDKLGTTAAVAKADEAAAHLRSAVTWLKDPARFPGGSYVVFANVYEYTDTSGDLASCPAATLAGMAGSWSEGAPAVVHFQEQILKVAVDTKTDMVFLLEHFCGHGFKRTDASLQCYRGPNAPGWFDLTCIHPTPEGHGEIAKLFASVIDG